MKVVSIGDDKTFHLWCKSLNLKPEVDAFYIPPTEPHRAHAIKHAAAKGYAKTEADLLCDEPYVFTQDEKDILLAS